MYLSLGPWVETKAPCYDLGRKGKLSLKGLIDWLQNIHYLNAEIPCSKRAQQSTMGNKIWLVCIQEILVVTKIYVYVGPLLLIEVNCHIKKRWVQGRQSLFIYIEHPCYDQLTAVKQVIRLPVSHELYRELRCITNRDDVLFSADHFNLSAYIYFSGRGAVLLVYSERWISYFRNKFFKKNPSGT